jgi:hypothetical protein
MPELAPTRQVPRLTNGAVEAEDARLKEQFKQQLLAALDLNLSALDKISAPEIASEALGAAQALKRHARANDRLNDALKLVESESARALEQTQGMLAMQYDDDAHAIRLLDECAREIVELLPALLLLPEGRLIDGLIVALEEAEADDRLNDDEHFLLSRLQKLKGDLKAMNASDPAAWQSVAGQVKRWNDEGTVQTFPASYRQKLN